MHILLYVEKYWSGENLARFASANAHQCSETTENLPSGSPSYSYPFTSQVSIRQNLTPSNFSHI